MGTIQTLVPSRVSETTPLVTDNGIPCTAYPAWFVNAGIVKAEIKSAGAKVAANIFEKAQDSRMNPALVSR